MRLLLKLLLTRMLQAMGASPHPSAQPSHSLPVSHSRHRRTAQRRAKLACDLKYWRLVHKYNRWLDCPKCGAERTSATCPNEKCKYKGRSRNRDGSTNTKEFCRPYAFEIDLEKFLTAPPPKYVRHFCARTWKEHEAATKRGEHPNVTEMPARKPAQPTPPLASSSSSSRAETGELKNRVSQQALAARFIWLGLSGRFEHPLSPVSYCVSSSPF